MKTSEFLSELLIKQLKSVPNDKKLKYNDLKRLCKYLDSNIFDENKCCTTRESFALAVRDITRPPLGNLQFL